MNRHAASIQLAIKFWTAINTRNRITLNRIDLDLLDRLVQVAIKHLAKRRAAQARKRARLNALREQALAAVQARLGHP